MGKKIYATFIVEYNAEFGNNARLYGYMFPDTVYIGRHKGAVFQQRFKG